MAPSIAELQKADTYNVAASTKVLSELCPHALRAVDAAYAVLEEMTQAFGAAKEATEFSAKVDEWLQGREGNPYESLRLLHPEYTGPNQPPLQVREAYAGASSVAARTYLLLRAQRDLLDGVLHLLRLRLTTALGILRVQTETVALVHLFREQPTVAVRWLEALSTAAGRQFYNSFHGRVVKHLKSLGLYNTYALGSFMSLHSRPIGLAPALTSSQTADTRTIELSHQEINDPLDLLLWLAHHLRTHVKIVSSLPAALPEADLSRIDRNPLISAVDATQAVLHPLYRQRHYGQSSPGQS